MVAVDNVALLVHGEAAVRIPVEGKADVEPVLQNEVTQALDMGGAAVNVDIESVGMVVDDIGVSAEGIKDALRHLPGAAVGTVKADAVILIGARSKGDEVADIAIAPGGIVHRAAYLLAFGIGQIRAVVDIRLYRVEKLLIHLLAVGVDELYAIVIIRVVAGGDHYAAVKIVGARDVGNAGRAGDVQQVRVRTGGRQARAERRFKHIA